MVNYDYKAIIGCVDSIYNDLYTGKLRVDGYKYIEMYDKLIKYPSFLGFIRNLVKHRGDVYASDREVIALMYYVDKSGMKFKPKAKKKSAWDAPYY